MRIRFFTLILALFVGMGAIWAQDYDFSAVCSTGQTLYYKIIDADAHTAMLTAPHLYWFGFTEPVGDIVLPEMVEYNDANYSVTEINDDTFNGCEGLTGSLNIPNSIIKIGESAFCNCSGFNGLLTIGNSVVTIGKDAFQSCIGFTGSLAIGNSVATIGDSAFRICSGFNGSLSISNSVTSIGDWAFDGCSGLNGSLTIGNSLSMIGEHAFENCSGVSCIISKASTPPNMFWGFDGIDTSIPVYVPCGCSEAYSQVEEWNYYFSNFHEFKPYDINLFLSDETMGTVAFAQLPDCETGICIVKATPMSGYKFDYWKENGEQVSTEAEYTFEATSDRTLTAYFSETLNVNSFVEPEVQLFPNPTNDVLNVVCDGMLNVAIMNALGQVVYDAEPADAQSVQVSLSGFNAGLYIVCILTDSGIINRQVIKAEQ